MSTSSLPRAEVVAAITLSLLLIAGRAGQWLPLGMTEVLGFVTGGICVWLVVREHLWNWPIGLANNVVFFVLFLQSRLFADMGLQVVYFALGAYGWWQWRFGGPRHGRLPVSRTTRAEWLTLLLLAPLGFIGLRALLIRVNGAAPAADAVTTILSLVAQYLLCRKRIENWWFWIAADLIYVPLYLQRALPLTALLYAGFLVLCGLGLRAWRQSLRSAEVGS
jgi:nicotinamide mononucleotide transporter